MKLSSYLWQANVTEAKLKRVLMVSDRTLHRWQFNPPQKVLNVIDEISTSRTIPKVDSWNGYFFKGEKLILPNGDSLTAEDINVLRFEQRNRAIMMDHPDQIRSLKDHLQKQFDNKPILKISLVESISDTELENWSIAL